ncbi:pyridoxamine 5'-phosphate oxidase family protein [Nocardioides gilvus]|uniref:pyridoxamine 5'-phosphate oxidase family protein n=1 Tax=Nocardioides gilvus TaxID=1735589 RepID=UPI000D740259|nr:pyridoxamine 5'-phosphate oxidase family protein [Nocardioides gilvus]
MALMRDGLVAHVGVDMGSHPVVLPSAYAVDPDGPDEGGTLYLHGSVGAGWIRAGRNTTLCVTVTELDGLVVARSPFHHSMNYRSAVVIGTARVVSDEAERDHALALIIDHMIPGRAATLRASTRKELAATEVLAMGLVEASMKERQGGPGDDPEDVAAGGWAGHVPLRRIAGVPLTAHDAEGEIPVEVADRARALGAG